MKRQRAPNLLLNIDHYADKCYFLQYTLDQIISNFIPPTVHSSTSQYILMWSFILTGSNNNVTEPIYFNVAKGGKSPFIKVRYTYML